MSDFQEVSYDNTLEGDIAVPIEEPTNDDDELSTLDEPVRVTFVFHLAWRHHKPKMPIVDFFSGYLPKITHRTVRNEDFRKTFHPIPVVNSPSVLLALCGVSGVLLHNIVQNIPLSTGAHWGVFYGCAGIWAGYYLHRTSLKSKMGRVKYAMDFMERHKDKIPPKKSMRYGDPECLKPWSPIR